jgi:hypothetical protein
MLTSRRSRIPVVPSSRALATRYAGRLEALAHPPGARPSALWSGLVSAVLGIAVGVCLHALAVPTVPAAALLTPDQRQLFGLVQDLSTTTTPDQGWVIQARIAQVLRTMHPQPRPTSEPLLPQTWAAGPRP